MGAIYSLTLRQLAGRWRLGIILVVSALPPLVAALMLRSSSAPSVGEFENNILGGLLAGAVAPLVVLAIAAAAFGNEVEDRTLTNLTLTPLPRWRIALPKLLAAITVAAPPLALGAAATAWIAFLGDPAATLAVTAAALLGVVLYASAFVWLGLVSAQAIGLGLLYIVLWEGLLSGLVGGVRLVSIRYCALGAMHALDPRRFATGEHLGAGAVAGLALVLLGGFFLLTVRRLRRMDVP